jgi:Ca2+-binding RTX toxin-like protein
VVKGSDASDVIAIDRRGDAYNIAISGRRDVAVPRVAVKRILVEANGGDDRVGIARSLDRVPVTIYGGPGNDTITGGLGDTLIGGGGRDLLFVPNLTAPFNPNKPSDDDLERYQPAALLSGGAGNDTLVAGGMDVLAGGPGRDIAMYFIDALAAASGGSVPAENLASSKYARDMFGPRVTGVEDFDSLLGSHVQKKKGR